MWKRDEEPDDRLEALLREYEERTPPGGASVYADEAGGDEQAAMTRADARLIATARAARWRPDPRAALGLVAVLVVVCAVLGFRVWRAEAGATPIPIAAKPAPADPSAVPPTIATPAMADPAPSGIPAPLVTSAAPATLTVHVVGQVADPGVVQLPGGARVVDAVEAAGGVRGRADLAQVNLARPLADGEQIVIPAPGEAVAPPGVPPEVPPGTSDEGTAGAPVNLNTATLADLEALPGVGPVLAQRILDWRTEHGQFSDVEELGEVSGIGEKSLENLRPHVRV